MSSENYWRAFVYHAVAAALVLSGSCAAEKTSSYEGCGREGPWGKIASTFGGRSSFQIANRLASPRMINLAGQCGLQPPSSKRCTPMTAWARLL